MLRSGVLLALKSEVKQFLGQIASTLRSVAVVMATVDLLEYDFLVALAATTSSLVEGRRCLLALHWTVVDVTHKAVSQPDTAYVRPRFDSLVLREHGEKTDLETSIHSEPLATVIQQVPFT